MSDLTCLVICRNGETGKVNGIKIFDLQLSSRASPMIDLVYFFGSSTTPEFREMHLEELLAFYHSILVQRLEALGHDKSVYTLKKIKEDFNFCYPFGFFMAKTHAMVNF